MQVTLTMKNYPRVSRNILMMRKRLEPKEKENVNGKAKLRMARYRKGSNMDLEVRFQTT